jgi:surface antigen
MTAVHVSYNGATSRRQSFPVLRIATVALVAASLGGCAGLGLPFGERGTRTTAMRDAAQPKVMQANLFDRVDPSDWGSLKDAIALAPDDATGGIEWENPITGTTGTMAVAVAVKKGGMACRTFATTINDTRGIRRYRGDACDPGDGMLQFRGVTADDATIS